MGEEKDFVSAQFPTEEEQEGPCTCVGDNLVPVFTDSLVD